MKLIPYGKYLRELQRKNMTPPNDVYLFIGDHSWKPAKNFQISRPYTICLPPNESPHDFIFPIASCDILMVSTSDMEEELIYGITLVLFQYNARIVRYIDNYQKIFIFKKD